MLCEITLERGYLRVDLFDRQTAAEMRAAVAAIAIEARKRGCSQILISVHASRPIFKVEQSGLLDCFRDLGAASQCRIALTADSEELKLSQDYMASVALGVGINVRSFPSRQAALDWLRDRRGQPDRRLGPQAWSGKERRVHSPRRRRESPSRFA
jgi:hypothetical protein